MIGFELLPGTPTVSTAVVEDGPYSLEAPAIALKMQRESRGHSSMRSLAHRARMAGKARGASALKSQL
jgi:hypothetical protein